MEIDSATVTHVDYDASSEITIICRLFVPATPHATSRAACELVSDRRTPQAIECMRPARQLHTSELREHESVWSSRPLSLSLSLSVLGVRKSIQKVNSPYKN
uniref:Uncharacterized protein n=1 Tax=Vitrella brassicaformis TaxID=1169539 RepID=A0A7S1KDI1_9ALVE